MMHKRWLYKIGIASVVLSFSFFAYGAAVAAQETIQADLATAPNVPAPLKRTAPARVVVKLEAKEFVGALAEGVQYGFWSFNGAVPGPMIRVRQGDSVELHLSNPKDSNLPTQY